MPKSSLAAPPEPSCRQTVGCENIGAEHPVWLKSNGINIQEQDVEIADDRPLRKELFIALTTLSKTVRAHDAENVLRHDGSSRARVCLATWASSALVSATRFRLASADASAHTRETR
mmetsp:Transcript_73920/g.196956  ORF Transcript_73920/g.196956 Transcript_73920/m.196956 type:complete len:117 (-) Transcript_73920:213-563(-)